MPVLAINTNVPQAKVSLELVKKLVDVVATTLGKPKNYVVVQVTGGQAMSWGGGEAACAAGRLTSIGAISRANNEKLQAGVAVLLEKELAVSPEHLYITFEDVAPANIGWKKSTFADLFG